MGVRTLRAGSSGGDVRAVQAALNRNASLDTDGVFGHATREAVIAFQTDHGLQVDGVVGPETRRALFPLVGLTIEVFGTRLGRGSAGRTGPALTLPRLTPALTPPSVTPPFTLPAVPPPFAPGPLTGPGGLLQMPSLLPPLPLLSLTPPERSPVTIPGLAEPIMLPPITTARLAPSGPDWQQVAQTQRQFRSLFKGPFADSFAVGVQSVFLQKNTDNHVELTTGCLLQSPIGFTDRHGNDFTLACFAQATWVDPIFHYGMFHLANPYAQLQAQGNATGPTNPTVQVAGFPVNINVDLNDDGLQLNANAGAVWSLAFEHDGLHSSWGTALGVGLVGKFRLLDGGR